jgi:hypothetical protein
MFVNSQRYTASIPLMAQLQSAYERALSAVPAEKVNQYPRFENLLVGRHRKIQSRLTRAIEKRNAAELVATYNTRQRVLQAGRGNGDHHGWQLVRPGQLDIELPAAALAEQTRYHLHLPMPGAAALPSRCPLCNLPIDALGYHPLYCQVTGLYRHNLLQRQLGSAMRLAGLTTGRPDPTGHCDGDGKQVDWIVRGFMTIAADEAWVEVAIVASEVGGASAERLMRHAAKRPGSFIKRREQNKTRKYAADIPANAVFFPAVWETAGRMGPGLLKLMQLLEAEAKAHYGTSAATFRRQVRHRLSATLAIANHVEYQDTRRDILRRMPSPAEPANPAPAHPDEHAVRDTYASIDPDTQRAIDACFGPHADPLDLRRGAPQSTHPTAPDEPIWVPYDAFGPVGETEEERDDYAAFMAATAPSPAREADDDGGTANPVNDGGS